MKSFAGALFSAASACGASALWVAADAGAMGGYASEELIAPLSNMVPAAWRCPPCDVAESADIATFARRAVPVRSAGPMRMVETPEGLSVLALATWLGSTMERRLTWVPFVAEDRVILAMTPADISISVVKLLRACTARGLPIRNLHPADPDELRALGMDCERLSPVARDASLTIVADVGVSMRSGFHMLSSTRGWVLDDVEPNRDLRLDLVADIGVPDFQAACLRCGSTLEAIRGIEVGHIFKLGTHFTETFGARASGYPLHMGSFGLGITRLLHVIATQHRDQHGLVWPRAIAPYAAVVMPLTDDPAVRQRAEQIYFQLRIAGLDVLLDDDPAPLDQRLEAVRRLGLPLVVGCRSPEVTTTVEVHDRASQRACTLELAAVGYVLSGSRDVC